MSTPETAGVAPELVERFVLKAFVEACLLLEEGVASHREIDLGMMLGTGTVPGPFARADLRGLDEVLVALEGAAERWGDGFAPPLVLRRLVAQGRLGAASGQGFYPYPRPDPGYEEGRVKLDSRGRVAIVWLDNPPANAISLEVIGELERAWRAVVDGGEVRAVVLASPNPALFSAGADVKAFAGMDPETGREMLERGHALLREWERSPVMTIAAVNGLAYGGGCELVMACDVRLAAYSATLAQPEITLGIMPGLGGTQRLPRLVGPAKALEMNATGEAISAEDAYEHGLVNRVLADHELFDAALSWARKLAEQAPLALQGIKGVSHAGDLDAGIAAEKEAFASVFASEDAREGITAFVERRTARFEGR